MSNQPSQGGCLCGKIRYEFSVTPTMIANCYCRDCQKVTGSQFTTILAIPGSELVVSGMETGEFTVNVSENRKVKRQFCPACGTQLFTHADLLPDTVCIKVTTLDNPVGFRPTINFFLQSALPWSPVDASLIDAGTTQDGLSQLE
jgi:hypothetical protein